MISLLSAAIVVLISFDGLKPTQVTPQTAPHLYQMGQEGASAATMEPSFPASTFINHASLITGCTPEEHGIVSNHFIDPKRGEFHMSNDAFWQECEPLWAAAGERGIKSASYVWPMTNDSWHSLKPTYVVPIPKKDSDKFFEHFDDGAEWRQLLEWLKLPDDKRPQLILGYFPRVDAAGHQYGPDASATLAVVKKYDKEFGEFLRSTKKLAIYPNIHFVIVSDHGMALGTKPIFTDTIMTGLKEKMGSAHWKQMGTSATLINFYFDRQKDVVLAESYLKDFPLFHVYSSKEFPEYWHYHNVRSGNLIVTVDPPYFLTQRTAKKSNPGFHGYDPRAPEMQAFFTASGPAFKPVHLPAIRNIDVAPTIAKILGIRDWEKHSGRPIYEILQ